MPKNYTRADIYFVRSVIRGRIYMGYLSLQDQMGRYSWQHFRKQVLARFAEEGIDVVAYREPIEAAALAVYRARWPELDVITWLCIINPKVDKAATNYALNGHIN